MTSPARYFTRLLLFLLIVAAVAYLLFPSIEQAFMTSPVLNGVIVAVAVTGVFLNFRTLSVLRREIRWVEKRKLSLEDSSLSKIRLLAPLAVVLKNNKAKGNAVLSPTIARSILDSVSARLEEDRDISRYLIGLSTFLGLLGTFWGLMITIASVGEVIASLNVSGEDAAAMFDVIKEGLKTPLAGMGTAFSSSLLGLAGALILGFSDLQTSQAQNSFYNDLDEFLASLTRYSSAVGNASDDSVSSSSAYANALLEQSVESLADIRRKLSAGENERRLAMQAAAALVQALNRIESHLAVEETHAQSRSEALLTELRDSFKLLTRTLSGGDK